MKSHKGIASNTPNERPTIGFINMEINTEWSMWPWLGIVDAAARHGVNLIAYIGKTIAANRTDEQANVVYQFAKDERLDGLIVWKAGLVMMLGETEIVDFLQQYPLPLVTLEGSISGTPCVSYENYQGMRTAVDHLVDVHGYQRIGFLGMYEHHKGFQERYRGYIDAMRDHGLPVDLRLARPWFDPQDLNGARIAEPLLDRYLDEAAAAGVQAIIGIADDIANQVFQRLQQRGIQVPEEVAVVGFDNFTESAVQTPPLTCVMPSWYEFGQLAAETLLGMLAGKPAPEELLTPSSLKIRQSCGCQDAHVRLAGKTQAAAVGREEAITRMCQAGQDNRRHAREAMGRLLESFQAEIDRQMDGNFLKTLEQTLQQVIYAGSDLGNWHDVISVLRECSPPTSENAAAYERLLQQAQVAVGRASERAQAARRFQATQQENRLRTASQRLITALDVAKLVDVLAEELPGLGIPACYLSLFEDNISYTFPNPAPEWARLVLAYDERGHAPIEAGGRRFRAQRLVPDDLWPPDKNVNFVVKALFVQEEPLGFIVFDGGARDGTLLEALRVQISSALQSAILMQRVQERSAELARQNYILDMFMENVPDSIYFKDTQSRFTRMNKALLDKLEASDYAETYGKTDFDFFPQEQAQAKYDQEQHIIATGQPILSLEEPDGEEAWALTTKMPLRDEKGQIVGTFGISRNITELVKAKQTAEAAKDEAVKARKEALLEKEAAEEARRTAEAAQKEAERARRDTEAANASLAAQIWQTIGQAQLNEKMRGEQDIPTLARNVIRQLCKYLGVQVGALYTLDDNLLKLSGTYAYPRKNQARAYEIGEGMVGEAALGKEIIFVHLPQKYIALASLNLGKLPPQNVLFAPFAFDDEVVGVIELGTLDDFTQAQKDFLAKTLEGIAIAFMTAQARRKVNELLAQTRQQAEELQAQEEELRATNEELEAQTESLRASEERLKQNQAALEAANADLEEKTHVLQEQQAELDRQNQVLRDAQAELQRRAEELALASKYKSEFLANMSHELRTPLNSMLILAGMLAKNEDGNLSAEQVESAEVIHSGGTDLLNLINEILDLAKVEAGKMEFHFAPMGWDVLLDRMHAQFDPLAQRKGLDFVTTVADGVPGSLVTDGQRLAQIVKNLLSNAFKFTEQGQVSLHIHRPAAGVALSAGGLTPETAVAVSVRDTGIGMTPEQQQIVFEAFQQADGSTSRQYGGTGLGLAITREMTQRLGGQVALESEPGKGSTFTIYLPLAGDLRSGASQGTATGDTVYRPVTPSPARPLPASPAHSLSPLIPDDRDELQPGDKTLLIVEDDPTFAKTVRDYAHKRGFKAIAAGDGESALALCKAHPPAAIVLDLKLPGMSGWDVLDALKDDPDLRHIPVHIMSAEHEDLSAYQRGAMGFLTKPISQQDIEGAFARIEGFIDGKIRSLLLVEDDDALRRSVKKLLEGADVAIHEAAS
ncbi:MAG: ATP-binding protein, partial [Chloroflexota bacterium]